MRRIIYINILLVSSCLLSSCAEEYRNHFFATHDGNSVASGSLISSPDARISILPDPQVKTDLLISLRSAKKRVWIEVYTWTDKDILNAVLDAKKRSVDVRVILEGNVYGTPRVNATIFSLLKKGGIPVVYADNSRFTFTHAKFFIVDDRYYISTGNLTRSFFLSNREFLFTDTLHDNLAFLESVFLADFAHREVSPDTPLPDTLVLSPTNSRIQIESLLNGANSSIDFYVQTLTDPSILDILHEKNKSGIKISICTADTPENSSQKSANARFSWKLQKKPYLHAKIIFIDGKQLFLGSQNITENALERNREVGILFSHDEKIFAPLFSRFQKDCQ